MAKSVTFILKNTLSLTIQTLIRLVFSNFYVIFAFRYLRINNEEKNNNKTSF